MPVANEKGWFTHWVSVQRDVTDRKRNEEVAVRARVAEAENLALEGEIEERKRVEAQLLYEAYHDGPDEAAQTGPSSWTGSNSRSVTPPIGPEPAARCCSSTSTASSSSMTAWATGAGDLLLMETAAAPARLRASA